MSDHESLNNLEQMLGTLSLLPSDEERSKILLACGRAEGRVQADRTIRKLRAGLFLFAGVAACLLVFLIYRPTAPGSLVDPNTRAVTKLNRPESESQSINPKFSSPTPRKNKAFGVTTRLSNWEFDTPSNSENPTHEVVELVDQSPILSVGSRSMLNELLN